MLVGIRFQRLTAGFTQVELSYSMVTGLGLKSSQGMNLVLRDLHRSHWLGG